MQAFDIETHGTTPQTGILLDKDLPPQQNRLWPIRLQLPHFQQQTTGWFEPY